MNQINTEIQSSSTVNLFTLNTDYNKTLLYFELEQSYASEIDILDVECPLVKIDSDFKLNEQFLKDKLKQIKEILNVYVLYGNRSLLIVCQSENDLDLVELNVNQLFNDKCPIKLVRKSMPSASCADQSSSATYSNYMPILVCEITDTQLNLISSDKYTSIKTIESKTGLKLKKIKKNIYFSGILYQFVILNSLLSDKLNEYLKKQETEKPIAEIVSPINEQTILQADNNNFQSSEQIITLEKQSQICSKSVDNLNDWQHLFRESDIKFNFKLKSRESCGDEDFYYDIYIFNADLTDLNTDGIVNATNKNLHPGYVGDGISRRIREKAGKQMQDACKRILKQDFNNQSLNDSACVYTKSFGKLKSKYVLHTVAPTWTSFIVNETSSNVHDKFEPCLEETFINILKQAHDSKLDLSSLAFPAASTSSGGAFDLPLELYAHTLYTQLVDFKVPTGSRLKTICLTSLEKNTTQTLCDIFSGYYEMYSETSWAMPLSPMSRLLQAENDNRPVLPSPPSPQSLLSQSPESSVQSEPESQSIILSSINVKTPLSPVKNNTYSQIEPISPKNNLKQQIIITTNTNNNQRCFNITNNNITNNNNNSQRSHNYNQSAQSNHQNILSKENVRDYNNRISYNNHQNNYYNNNYNKTNGYGKQRTISNENNDCSRSSSSGSTSGSLENTTVTASMQDFSNLCCLFCQKETTSKNSNFILLKCGNMNCRGAFCSYCITNHLSKQKVNGVGYKCPSCMTDIEKSVLQKIFRNDRSSSSSSASPTRLNSIHNNSSYYNTNANNNKFNITILNSNYNNHSSCSSSSSSTTSNGPSYPVSQNKNNNGRYISSNGQNGHKYPIVEGKIYIRKLDEPCDGYDNFKSLLITFEIEDGIQNEKQPKPGHPYKGTSKRAYLPEIKEHREILAFYEKALKSGMLFKLEFSRNFGDYRVHLNQDVLLKTSQHGGGRFGYPDNKYIDELLRMARSFR